MKGINEIAHKGLISPILVCRSILKNLVGVAIHQRWAV
jgi:hypothetical protein